MQLLDLLEESIGFFFIDSIPGSCQSAIVIPLKKASYMVIGNLRG